MAYYFGGNNLVTGQAGTASPLNVFLYNVAAGTNTLVSHTAASATTAGDNPTNSNLYEASGPAISANGQYVAYANNSTTLLATALTGQNGQDNVYLYNAMTGTNTLVSHAAGSATTPDANGGTSPSISNDGRYVSYIDYALPSNVSQSRLTATFSPTVSVRVFDSQASATAQPAAVGLAFDPSELLAIGATLAPTELSGDGTTTAWVGLATNAAFGVTGDLNGTLDVFVTAPAAPSNGPTSVSLSNTTVHAAQPIGTTIGTLTATDTNSGQTFTFTLTGPNANLFTLTGSTLTTNTVFAVGVPTNITVGVHVVDTLGLTLDTTIIVTVLPAPPTNITLSNSTINATQPLNTTVGTLSTTDPNAGQSFTYTVTSNPANLFTITGNTLQTNTVFAVGSPTTYSITVTTTDTLGLTYSKNFTITVNPVAPTNITLSNTTITAAQPTGTTVGTLSTTDPNPNQSFTYTLSGPAASQFTIANTNTLQTNTVFSVATPTTYSITVTTTDTLGLTYSKSFTITVNPAPPTNIALSNTTVSAAQPINTIVGTLSTTDPNPSQSFSYTLTGANPGQFTISNNTLQTTTVFAVGAPTNYNITVQTTDTLGLTYSKTFTITVNPALPTNIALSNSTIVAAQPTGTTVGTLSTTDPNAGQSFTYTLTNNANNQFTLSNNTLQTNAVFAVGAPTTYSITVQTMDTLGLTYSKTFTITVNPALPTNITLSNSTIVAAQPTGTTVGTLSTTDPNAGQSFSYTLSGTDASKFSISNNTLQTNVVFAVGAPTTYSITVTTTDTLGLTYQKPFTITVNPAPPTNIALSNSTIVAAQPTSTTVGTLSTTDPNAGQSFSYTLSGTDASKFSVNGGTLQTNYVFAVGVPTTYSITVQTTDTLGLTYSKSFTITVNPAPPTNITLSNTAVTAYRSSGTVVGTLSTTDPNAGQSFSYALSGTDASKFSISGGTLQTAAVFPVTTMTTYSITVTTTDSLGLTYAKPFTITVNPSTATPTDISLSNQSVASSQPAGVTVGMFTTTDPNVQQTFTYVLSGPAASFLTVNGNMLQTGTLPTVTTQTNYSLTVQTTDSLGFTYSKTFTITLFPNGPTNIALSNSTISAAQLIGTTVGTLSTTDTNSGQSFTYTLSGPAASDFSISGSTLQTNVVFAVGAPTIYNITVTATDSLDLSFPKGFAITVNPVAPTNIQLSNSTIIAAQSVGATVGTLSTTDPNAGQSFSYTLSGTDASKFSVNGSTLQTNYVFAVGVPTTYSITVTTTDTLGLTYQKPFTITVNPAPPTNIALSNSTIVAAQSVGATVGTLSTTDPNAGQSFTYALSGTNASKFSVNGSTLQTNVVFAVGVPTTYSITVTTTDTLGLTYQKPFTITVNPAPPTDIQMSSAAVTAYQSAGTAFGLLTTTDPNAGQTFTYALSGTDASKFSVSGNTLETAAVFPVTTVTTYSITVTTTDSLGLTYAKPFTITVNPTTAAPTDISLSNLNVAANASVGSTVGTFTTTDPNAGQSFSYTLSGPAASFLTVSGNALLTGTLPTVTAPTSYSLTVQTTDSAALSFSKTLTLTLLPGSPTDIALTGTSVTAYQAADTTVGTLSTTDPNAGQSFTYTLSGTDASKFSISGNTLETAAVFPVTTVTTYSITVTTTDSLGLTYAKPFTITVNPTRAAPTSVSLSLAGPNPVLLSGLATGATVGTFSTTDPNAGQSFTYSLVSGTGGTNNAAFAISGNKLVTATPLTVTVPTTFSVLVRVTDSAGLSVNQVLTFKAIPNATVTPPAVVYVNQAWASLPIGTDPDGTGPALAIGYDAYATVPQGTRAVAAGGTVNLAAGTYQESVSLLKSMTLQGAGSASTVLSGSGSGTGILSGGATVNIAGLTVQNFALGLAAGAITAPQTGTTTSALGLTDVRFTGNTTGASLNGLASVTYTSTANNGAYYVDAGMFGRSGDNLVEYGNVVSLVIDGAGSNSTYFVKLANLGSGVTIQNTGPGSSAADFVATPGNDLITVTNTQVSIGSALASYRGLANVVITGDGGDDGVNIVRNTPTATSITVVAGSKNSFLMDNLTSIATTNQVMVGANTIMDSGIGGPVYLAAGDVFGVGVMVQTGVGNDVILVAGTLPGTPTTVDAGDGDNTLVAGSTAKQASSVLSGIVSPVMLEAGSGANTLVVSDAGNPAANTVYVTANAILGSVRPYNIYYQSNGGTFVSGLLQLGAGNNTVVLAGKPGTQTFTVYGNGGNNTFDAVVAPTDGIAGVNLIGGSGTNTLNVTDSSNTAVMQNQPTGVGQGVVSVAYAQGTMSQVNYYNMAGVNLSVSPDQSYIREVYQKVLQRDPTAQEEATGVVTLQQAGALAFVEGVESTTEAHDVVIKQWYQQYLNEAPDASFTRWVSELGAAGYTKTLSDFLATQLGGTDAQFIAAVYQDLLGTSVSAKNQPGLLALLQSVGRQAFVQTVLASSQFEQVIAAEDYTYFLGRSASAAELQSWATSKLDEISMDEAFLTSAEFMSLTTIVNPSQSAS